MTSGVGGVDGRRALKAERRAPAASLPSSRRSLCRSKTLSFFLSISHRKASSKVDTRLRARVTALTAFSPNRVGERARSTISRTAPCWSRAALFPGSLASYCPPTSLHPDAVRYLPPRCRCRRRIPTLSRGSLLRAQSDLHQWNALSLPGETSVTLLLLQSSQLKT